jgi:hypothetical protein
MKITSSLCIYWHCLFSFFSAEAYFVEEASHPYKWWEIYPEAGSMAIAMKTIYGNSGGKPVGSADSVVSAMKSTDTHAYGARGGNLIRNANLLNFSRRLGLLKNDLITFVDFPQQSIFQYVVPILNRQHFGRILVMEAHIKMCRRFLQSTHEYAIMLEDDVTFLGNLSSEEALSMTADAIHTFHKEKWDLLYLGFCFAANGTLHRSGTYQKFNDFRSIYVESFGALCTHAYIINRFTAKLFEIEFPRRLLYTNFHGLDAFFSFFQCKYGNFC